MKRSDESMVPQLVFEECRKVTFEEFVEFLRKSGQPKTGGRLRRRNSWKRDTAGMACMAGSGRTTPKAGALNDEHPLLQADGDGKISYVVLSHYTHPKRVPLNACSTLEIHNSGGRFWAKSLSRGGHVLLSCSDISTEDAQELATVFATQMHPNDCAAVWAARRLSLSSFSTSSRNDSFEEYGFDDSSNVELNDNDDSISAAERRCAQAGFREDFLDIVLLSPRSRDTPRSE